MEVKKKLRHSKSLVRKGVQSFLKGTNRIYRGCEKLIKRLKRIGKALKSSKSNDGKGINGSIERVKGSKVSLCRIDRHIDLTISGDRVIYKNYEDWKYLQTAKGHPGAFEKLWETTRDKQRKVWNFVEIKKTDNVLDVGFRDGFNLKELETKCSSVIGIDVNKHAIVHAKELGCQVFQEDIQQRTHFEDNSFDVIIMCDILEHCFSPENALEESNKLLKHGARMIIEVPMENTFDRNLLHGHSSLFKNKLVFERLLTDFGFSILKKDLSNKARNLYVVLKIKNVGGIECKAIMTN